jgi:tetratricopeptide (TPR) repeat protein
MSSRSLFAVALLALVAGTPALAALGGDPPRTDPSTSSVPDDFRGERSPRQEAERWYADAYDDIAKAKKDLEAGKAKNAEKRFRRARERAERAVELDSRYHEAWNLVGYAARKSGDAKGAVAAYEKCLALEPDYAPAREYLGEAFVEAGDLGRAEEQLRWLERLEAHAEAKTLRVAIEAARGASPDSSHASGASAG